MLKDRPDILGELRILLNFCVSDAFLLTFVFSGQKPLDGVLREMPEFWQRLPVRFFLKNLDYDDTRSLIQFRLRKAGAAEEIFSPDAYEGIYNYSEGCPRIICSIADLCLLVGYAKRSRRIGFVEVSNACRDMESSGDSFHYFAYIKNRDDNSPGPSEPERKAPRKPAPLPKKRPEPKPVFGQQERTVPCLNCAEDNLEGSLFCAGCGAALVRKCPACGTLIDTVSGTCHSCGADIERERISRAERLREELRPFDILERSYDAWLNASGMKLENEEKVIIIFPHGNFLTPGPSIHVAESRGKQHTEPCDLILTERRFLLESSGKTTSLPLERIETCMVSESDGAKRGKPILIIGTKDGIHTIQFPSGSARSKAMLDSIASFTKSMALK